MGGVAKAVGGVLGIGGKKKKKKADAADTTPVMPVADDEVIARAKKRSLIMQMGRGGRDSTILSTSDTLGG